MQESSCTGVPATCPAQKKAERKHSSITADEKTMMRFMFIELFFRISLHLEASDYERNRFLPASIEKTGLAFRIHSEQIVKDRFEQ